MKKILLIISLLFAFSVVVSQPRTTAVGIELIKYYEGFRPVAYKCPAGIWTAGFGTTENVRPGMAVTRAQAEQLLRKDLVRFEKHVKNSVERTLKWNEFDALVCFSYNVGYRINDGLQTAVNIGNTKAVVMRLNQFIYAKGKILPGLVKRRKSESALYQNEFYRIVWSH